MKTVIINDKRDGNPLYIVKVPLDTPKDQEINVALEKLVRQFQSLGYADITIADLTQAYIRGAGVDFLQKDITRRDYLKELNKK